MKLDPDESQRIKLIRTIAVCLILMTHISQEYKTGIEEWTNAGVQIFLIISGFLLGQKHVEKWGTWFQDRFIRLIPSYYTVLMLTAAGFGIFLNTNIVNIQFAVHFSTLHFLIFPEYPVWGGHLWYITAAVLCYCLFPLLCKIRYMPPAYFLPVIFFVMPGLLAVFFYKTPFPYRLSADIYSFVTGFAAARLFGVKIPPYAAVVSLCISFTAICLRQTVLSVWTDQASVNEIMYLAMPWIKVSLGLSLFLVFYSPVFIRPAYIKFINFTDKYSYEIFLSHKNFILGPLSLLHISPIQALNVTAAVALSVVSAVFVHKISAEARHRIADFLKDSSLRSE